MPGSIIRQLHILRGSGLIYQRESAFSIITSTFICFSSVRPPRLRIRSPLSGESLGRHVFEDWSKEREVCINQCNGFFEACPFQPTRKRPRDIFEVDSQQLPDTDDRYNCNTMKEMNEYMSLATLWSFTYKIPKLKMRARPTFCAVGNFSFQIVGSGRTKIAISSNMFPIPLMIYISFRFPHDPGWLVSQE